MKKLIVFWFRRDLRLHDNAALFHALKNGNPVLPVFIFDTCILEKLHSERDARVEFIHLNLQRIKRELRNMCSDILVLHGDPVKEWSKLIEQYGILEVYTNRDYEPYAIRRDQKIRDLLKEKGIALHTFKDHCIFEPGEILKNDGGPYTVFTPYCRRWKEKIRNETKQTYATEMFFENFQKEEQFREITLDEIGFKNPDIVFPHHQPDEILLSQYHTIRDYPALDGGSRLGVHFRFGTISIREYVALAKRLNETWLEALIWREFYIQIMFHFPHAMQSAFKPAYDRILWRNDSEDFEAWCKGGTGYPMVDAGMRQLNATGYMHNRLRMICAGFLCKHLLIDWRWGEAYFADKLLDFELAGNNGGWQWSSGSGTDAAPFFRIFNPFTQEKKFDPDRIFIKQWVAEYGSEAYAKPIVEHTFARNRCLQTYKEALV